jgi:hypothetical protein
MSYYDQMIDLQNATPGNIAVLKLSYNATFDKLHFKLGNGLTKAMIGTIEGKANGVTFFKDDAANLAILDAYLGVYTQADTMTLDFTEPNTRGGAAAQYLASIPRNLLKSLTFEVQILGTAPAGITLKAEAEYRDPTTNPWILRRKDFTIPLPATGDNDYSLPSGPNGGLIKRIRIHHGGNINKVELRTNGFPRKRADVDSVSYAQKRNRLTPQANMLMLDFIEDGNLMGMLDTSKATETLLRLTTSAADQARVYIDYIANLTSLT